MVMVEFNGQKVSTITKNGKWIIQLKPMMASLKPLSMTISGENIVVIPNIMIGEVWLCSGQSNMAFPLRAVKALGDSKKVEDVLKDAQNYPQIRQFSIPLKKSVSTPEKIDDVNGKWVVCDSINARNFSAVAYFFGKELYEKLKVPIGLINSSYGGTAIENWMSRETLESFPELQSIFTNYQKAMNEFPEKLEEYKRAEVSLLEKYRSDSTVAAQFKRELPRKPAPPMSPAERGGPTGLYNTMIYPLLPYAIKGVVWYQGEANASRGLQYRTLLPALINEWRSDWKNTQLPFFFIQIPGWKNHSPELKEAQLLTCQKLNNTAMTVIYDVDDTVDVHSGNKQPVGERLSLPARALVYGEKNLEYMGPVYESMKVEGDKVMLTFTHANKLVAKDGELKDFVIAGADKKFVTAKAEIKNNKLIVFSTEVKNPVAVRAGWRLCPQMNLYNEAGLPASPFRTDVE
jgi:sialate O-acetylesterase